MIANNHLFGGEVPRNTITALTEIINQMNGIEDAGLSMSSMSPTSIETAIADLAASVRYLAQFEASRERDRLYPEDIGQ